tara:strand:+ start:239 stop:703 length:465 start_codon:yes stop_codon:yes gene_type:complete
MIVCIVAFDQHSAIKLTELVKAIAAANPTVYILFVNHEGKNRFSNGALFNIAVQLAGFSPSHEICFFSFIWNRWNVSQRVSADDFLKSNGYNNYSTSASSLDVHRTNTCGYAEIFSDMCFDIQYNERCFHYTVRAAEDMILKLDFVHNGPSILL